MNGIDRIAEERERRAIEAGELDRLPGAGRPLRLDDDAGVPPELRAALRVMRNAGLVPEEVILRRDINALQAHIEALGDDAASDGSRAQAARRLALLRTRLEALGRPLCAGGYAHALRARFARG